MRGITGLLVLVVAVAGAQDTKYVKDPVHSEINFVAESRLLDAHGFWDRWDADITLDPAAWDNASVRIVIDTRSVNTRVAMRDSHLRSNAFFAADSFPQITFVSRIVNKLGDSRLNITGDLAIRGVTRTVTVPATIIFWDNAARTGRVKGNFTLVRSDFGIGFSPPGNPIADEVAVSFNITFRQASK